MRGPKPKSREQKVLEGNPGRRPLPEPLLIAGRPVKEEWEEPPEDLPEEGKEFWRTYVSRLVEVGVVDKVDVPQLENMAYAYARVAQARRVIAVEGHYTRGSVGQIREHPALRIEREYLGIFNTLAEKFAMDPVARTRLGLAELHRRTLQQEMGSALGQPVLEVIDGGDG